MAPIVALNLKKGTSTDILPHFGGSLEKAHAAIKYSRDVLRLLRPDRLNIYVCDDENNEIDVDELLGDVLAKDEKQPESMTKKKDRLGDETKPDMGEGALIAAVDQKNAEMTGEDSKSKAKADKAAAKAKAKKDKKDKKDKK